MWRKLFGFSTTGKGKERTPEARGYLRPLTAEEILDTENRQGLLKQIRDNSLMTKEGTEQYYLQPLRHCVNLMQLLPVTEKNHHAVVGGLVDFTLTTVAYALRLSRGYMLPQGAGAEEQSAQAATWNAVIFYAALCRSLTVFGLLEGELADGTLWFPGLVVPSQPYRLRFCKDREERSQALAILLGMRLLPEDVVVWLGRTPAALDTLLRIIRGEDRPGCVVSKIISEAAELAGEPVAEARKAPEPVVPAPAIPGPVASVVQPGAVVPVTGQGQIAVTSPDAGMVLGSALDGATVAGAGNTVVPEEPADQTIGNVMALMGFSAENPQDTADFGLPVEAPGNQSDKQPCVPEYVFSEDAVVSQVEGPTDDENYGAQFLSWLLEQINTGSLTINNSDSSLHVVSGLLFAPVPGIFRDFLRENKMQPRLRKKIQEDFESLNVHYAVKGKGLYSFQKYPEEGRVGDPEALFGYLIKIRKIMPAFSVSEDSQYLFIANKYNM
ncbi:TPA: TraI domain-containing protein [Salmonella enterica subsp. enterica serovar Muenchen]|nr:TraI domain-containing protein [Salmonella enterica subsp. enterica serovar Muenchen]EIN0891350.1 TraI domain-containing protein [Salmonella enterica]EJR0735190.1 TraI domain-containing protein [Salmonella enterica]ELZ0449533.1 TraI domain-containing protein [Salmonella enterica]HAG2581096.1 DNA-binding domain-containing protein [Salmonella enterica]